LSSYYWLYDSVILENFLSRQTKKFTSTCFLLALSSTKRNGGHGSWSLASTKQEEAAIDAKFQ
jgi:hypothetical protein